MGYSDMMYDRDVDEEIEHENQNRQGGYDLLTFPSISNLRNKSN